MKHDIRCKHCNRYLGTAVGTVIIEGMPCPNSKCRAKLNIKVVDSDSTAEQIAFRFASEEVGPKLSGGIVPENILAVV